MNLIFNKVFAMKTKKIKKLNQVEQPKKTWRSNLFNWKKKI